MPTRAPSRPPLGGTSAIDQLHARRTGRHVDEGFTLIEVVVSFVIFAIVAGAAVLAITNGMKTSDYTTTRVQAANVAQAALQRARANPSGVIASPTPVPAATTVGGRAFTVQQTAVVPSAGGTACPAGSEVPITVVVNWTDGATRQVRMDSVIAC